MNVALIKDGMVVCVIVVENLEKFQEEVPEFFKCYDDAIEVKVAPGAPSVGWQCSEKKEFLPPIVVKQ